MAKAGFFSALSGALVPRAKGLSPVASGRGGWWPIIRESFPGAWQKNVEVNNDAVLAFHAVYACITLIASDIAKLRIKLVEDNGDQIWTETTSPSFSPVLRKPNPFQNRIQFIESWIISKLTHGNTYALKIRDNRGVVVRLYVLDPLRTKPLVADNGDVFYELGGDDLMGEPEGRIVPAREIIHDRMNCLFHPLVGVSPIFACGLAATQGLKIQNNSAKFFGNNSQPGGILTAPDHIEDDTAARIKAHWEASYTGDNAGKVAVLGDGLEFKQMTMKATDAQLIEQLKWTAEVVCSTFHVPPYKIGVGDVPSFENVQALNIEYYTQCLQALIEALELCLDEGLGLDTPTGEGDSKRQLGTELDTDNLLRMDSVTQMEVLEKGIKGIVKPNEARAKLGFKPTEGGDDVFLQQQNYSLKALAKRDARPDPFSGSASQPAPNASNDDAPADEKSLRMAVEDCKGSMRLEMRKLRRG